MIKTNSTTIYIIFQKLFGEYLVAEELTSVMTIIYLHKNPSFFNNK